MVGFERRPPHPVLLPQGEKGRCCTHEHAPSPLAGEGWGEGELPSFKLLLVALAAMLVSRHSPQLKRAPKMWI